MKLKIGELARATGTAAPTVRYYEQIGLLPRPERIGAQRRYRRDDVRRLTFVRRCREFGFSIEQVRTLLTLMRDTERSCAEARDVAAAHPASVQEKLRKLIALERSISEVIDAADRRCAGGPGTQCVILEQLADADC